MTHLVTFTVPGTEQWALSPSHSFSSSFLRLGFWGQTGLHGRTATLGPIRVDFFGGTEKRGADCPLTFRKKKLNLAEIPVPQFEMGILTFALLGQHDQMRCRPNVLLLFTGYPAGPSYGAESDYMEPRLAPARDGFLFLLLILYFQLCLGHEESCGGQEVDRRASEPFCHQSPLWTLGCLLYVYLGRCTAALWLGRFRTWYYCFLLPLGFGPFSLGILQSKNQVLRSTLSTN